MILAHTAYSFHYGVLSTEEMLEHLATNGYTRFILADINNTSAVLDTLRLAPLKGLKPIVGVDFRNGVQQRFIAIAKNNAGYRRINECLSACLHAQASVPEQAPDLGDDVIIIYPLAAYKSQTLGPNCYIGIAPHEVQSLAFSAAKHLLNHCLALPVFSFVNRAHFVSHQLLRAIDQNIVLSKLQRQDVGRADESILPIEQMKKAYEWHPKLWTNAERVFEACELSFEYGKFANKNRKCYTRSTVEDWRLLRQLCEIGLTERYPKANRDIRQRMEKELQIIGQMEFAAYFLINWDLIQYARRRNFYYVGRGSGANSLVAYLLRITDVDPIDLDLYFERFINPYRTNPPDFDMDFSWTDREDITQYIFNRYGDTHTALLGAYNTFQHDAVIREIGKVMGMPAPEIDRLQRLQDLSQADSLGQRVLRYSAMLQGLPSHLSIHSSGILISEEPISQYSATFLPPKGFPTTQFSMLEAEDIGLYKFDILSQRGLAKIKEAVEIVEREEKVRLDIHDMPKIKNDPVVKRLLKEGECIGCFYIESPAMRMLLTKLRADDYIRLVAASSIIRPGVSKSGMMAEYIRRYRNADLREKAREALPELYDLLQETYGVMVYQEDVIKVAHYLAGLSLAEADYLRRGMTWKFKKRNEFNQVHQKFLESCRAKGFSEKTVQDLWHQIESFANYAFSKAHSASYAVESFQALYIKAYYPLAYMAATLNHGGGFYKPEFYVHEARRFGADIQAPCVNESDAGVRLKGKQLFIGLSWIQGIESPFVEAILRNRSAEGAFQHLADFVERLNPDINQLRLLIRIGAFRFTHLANKQLLWEAHLLVGQRKRQGSGPLLFSTEIRQIQLPVLTVDPLEEAYTQIELLGFPLCSPYLLVEEDIPSPLLASDLKLNLYREVELVGYLVAYKTTYTQQGDKMCFGTFLDLHGHWLDTVHFPAATKDFPFRGPGVYHLKGRVEEEFDFFYLNVSFMRRLNSKNVG